MAEMEKEGRPPENKRSRKPAHPVKREINEEMKSFAENTMNELLGWYGYDKVELRDSDNLDMGETPQHISVLKENLVPKNPASSESSEGSPDGVNSSQSMPASRNGVVEPAITTSTTTSCTTDHGNLPIIVPLIPPPVIKPSTDEDASNVQIMCAWCQKIGVKRYSLSMGSELKSFCSEKCFAACRRAYFKRNKARDDDGLGGKLPQNSFTQDTPRLVFKTNSDVLVCDWCKHIRHTKEYLDFGAGERRLQFCSAKCLNQYKMDIFYKETQAALPGALCNPGHGPGGEGKSDCGGAVQLLTPESWGTPLADLRRKAPSPCGPSTTSSATSPPDSVAVCSPSSSSSAKIPTPRPHESSSMQAPPISTLHPPVGVPSGSPPMVMTSRGPMPLPLFMEHQMMHQMRPPYLRPSAHPAGANSPLSNPIIPGIGPPPPPRSLGPTPSPMHRPLLSPHVHPSSNHNPPMMPPHPGLPMPGLPPFPPVNIIPSGHIPFPPMMNFGMPSLTPLVPPPTMLVPYPVIVPLPVPIPIPIPIPLNPKTFGDQSKSNISLHRGPETSASGPLSPGPSRSDKVEQKVEPSQSEQPLPVCSETSRTALRDLKSEDTLSNLCLTSSPGPIDGVIDLTVGHRSCQHQVIQRRPLEVQVKVEEEAETRSSPAAMFSREGNERHEEGGAGPSQDRCSPLLLEGATHPRTLSSSSPPSSINSPCCNGDPPGSQLNTSFSSFALSHLSSPERTTPQSFTQLQPNPGTPCNVIVNGTGWHSLLTPATNSYTGQKGDRVVAEEEVLKQPNDGELEHEALKENNCYIGDWEPGKAGLGQEEMTNSVMGKPDPDSNLEEGEHAYALPLMSAGGCVVIQPVPKSSTDKTAILSCSISTPVSAAGSPELEPPLKRRCLRIRNQNK